jgi:hypothetical protein
VTSAGWHLHNLLYAGGWLASYPEYVEVTRKPPTVDHWLAMQRLWIDVGNGCEGYRQAAGIAPGVEPWAGPVLFRNKLSHTPSWLIDQRIVERAIRERLPELLKAARKAREEMED